MNENLSIGYLLAALFFCNGLYAQQVYPKVERVAGGYQYVNKYDEIVFDRVFSDARSFGDGYAAVKEGDYWGYIDLDGQMVIPFQYDKVGRFRAGLSWVNEGGEYSFIDKEGMYANDEVYDQIMHAGDHYLIKAGNNYGLCDSVGQQVLAPIYEDYGGYYKGNFLFRKVDGWYKWREGIFYQNGPFYFGMVDKHAIYAAECLAEEGDRAQKRCGDKKMLTALYHNLKYPAIARERGVQGTVVVQFIIDKRGRVSQTEVLSGIGSGCDEEARYRVSQLTFHQPAMKDGEPVNSIFVFPVKFKLE